jgi:hypothetical protein
MGGESEHGQNDGRGSKVAAKAMRSIRLIFLSLPSIAWFLNVNSP